MAYTKSPSVSTYETKRGTFVYSPLQRNGGSLDKDAKLVNMMVEVFQTPDNTNQKVFVKSRPGLEAVTTHTAGTGRGIYYWTISGTSHVICVIGNTVYSDTTNVLTLTTSTGDVGFTEFVDGTGAVKLIMCDGTKGYVFTAATTVTEITDVNFPTPHCPSPVFMDGYIFVAKSGTQDIYNCVVEDPMTWQDAGSPMFISAEMYPDKIVALSKNNNYIYAVGSQSIEYFYDAANSTGSPLGRHASAVQQFGTVAPATVVQTEKEVILLGETGNGGHTIWTINGFKEKEIGTPAIRSILRAEGSALPSATAHCIRAAGQKLYVVTLTNISLVYSFDTEMWHFWTSGSAGDSAFIGRYAADGPNGMAYILGQSTGIVYSISESNHTDNGTAFLCQIVTAKYDFDTMNQKTMSRFTLIGDIPDGSGAGNTVQVYWTDNDYQTWSSARDLSFDYDFPMIAQLGRFRRRAFKIEYSQPYNLRLEGFEVDINKGNQ